MMSDNTPSTAGNESLDELRQRVAELIVTALNLDVSPEEIGPDTQLFGEGLGLDSIDILEVAMVVSKHFGFQLRSDSEDNERIFRSMQDLAQHIAENRTK